MTTLYCATPDAVAQQTGLYYDQCAVATPRPWPGMPRWQALWTASEGWTQDCALPAGGAQALPSVH